MQDETSGLGRGQIYWLASIVQDGTATPEEARALLDEFVRQADSGQIEPRLIQHLRDCIAAYLTGTKALLPTADGGRSEVAKVKVPTLDKALGIVRPIIGQPRTDGDTLAEVAMEVLRWRLERESFHSACVRVAAKRKRRGVAVTSVSHIKEVAKSHAKEGVVWLSVANDRDFTQAEQARLNELYWGELWFCPPGCDARARRAAIQAEMSRGDADPATIGERAANAAARFDAPFKPAALCKRSSPKKQRAGSPKISRSK